MSDRTPALYRRIRRRETHSPRSTLAVVLAVIAIVAALWLIAELVLEMLRQPALLATVPALAGALSSLTTIDPLILGAIGIAVAVIGVIIVIASLAPGGRPRQILESDATAAIVDNEVIASALARHAALAAGVDSDSVRVTVSSRAAVVDVTPTSGLTADSAAVRAAVQTELDSYRLRRPLTAQVRIAPRARVGA